MFFIYLSICIHNIHTYIHLSMYINLNTLKNNVSQRKKKVFKSGYLTVGLSPIFTPGTQAYMQNVLCGGFCQGILIRIYPRFGENHGKLQKVRSTSATGNLTRHSPSTSFERRTTSPLVGPFSEGILRENKGINLLLDWYI